MLLSNKSKKKLLLELEVISYFRVCKGKLEGIFVTFNTRRTNKLEEIIKSRSELEVGELIGPIILRGYKVANLF